jgi:hypothetical protein
VRPRPWCSIGDRHDAQEVQILSTNGDEVATIEGNGVGGEIFGLGGDDHVVTLFSHDAATEGTYVYDLRDGRFLRISQAVSNFGIFATAPDGDFLWSTPVNGRHGGTQWLGELTS